MKPSAPPSVLFLITAFHIDHSKETVASVIVAINFLLGILCAALAIPLIQRRVPPNRLYGFRTPKTLRNESIWYQANAYAGKTLLLYGLTLSLTSLVLSPIYLWQPKLYILFITMVALLGIGVILYFDFCYLNRL
ncbi:SdpI family protein [Chthonomonas calidirosea]|uniref:SdpI family protein n=1 Tax=Chthonomonas calidirosea TaxID=454171 RepID=UPI0009ECB78F